MINLDQLYVRNPVTSFDGSEVLPLQKDGVTGASLLSVLKTYLKAAFVANDISNASTIGKTVLTAANLAAAKTALEVPDQPKASVTVEDDTTLTSTHRNRRVFVSATATITLDASVFASEDYVQIINITTGGVTIDAGAGEALRVAGSATTDTTYELPAGETIKLFLIDSSTWYIET